MDQSVTIRAFYKFVKFENHTEMKEPLEAFCKSINLKGTILLAHEGINGTVSGRHEDMTTLIEHLRSIKGLEDLKYKESYADFFPFNKMKVHLKKEIVTIGLPEVDPSSKVGTYIKPEEWNDLISDPEVVLVDTRNDYEVSIGTFKNAVNPNTKSFRDFPKYVKENLDPKKHKKVAMFCTGGIRCEKSTSYLLQEGFKEVYHLDGGILQYFEDIPEEKSMWEGDCFVFDHRVSVNQNLEESDYEMCFACRQPLSVEDMQSPKYEVGISCPYCLDTQTEEKRKSMIQRQIQKAKAKEQQAIQS